MKTETITAPLEFQPDPMTPQEVADVLRIGRSTVFRLISAGEIRHLRVGRSARARVLIYKADLQAWIEKNKQGEITK